MKESIKFRIVIDTNVLFSAIRYRGKPFELFEVAEKKGVKILIPEYVYDELKEVFTRNNLNFDLVTRFLATYSNVSIVERELRDDLVDLAKKKVQDRKDRPIFVYTLLLHEENSATCLVTGDKALRDALNGVKEGLALTVDEVLNFLSSWSL
ncbi:hypothetical protein DRP05_11835 [Archaeoglobales archaeon]|nr:MAG: hypothetical protein DRP05_11835 [Archaeoglobales archaeon]